MLCLPAGMASVFAINKLPAGLLLTWVLQLREPGLLWEGATMPSHCWGLLSASGMSFKECISTSLAFLMPTRVLIARPAEAPCSKVCPWELWAYVLLLTWVPLLLAQLGEQRWPNGFSGNKNIHDAARPLLLSHCGTAPSTSPSESKLLLRVAGEHFKALGSPRFLVYKLCQKN